MFHHAGFSQSMVRIVSEMELENSGGVENSRF
jgi:hypothetical protein